MNEPEEPVAVRKRKTEEAELDMTAMIDVTFLLLAFFVVVSKMDPQATVNLPAASNAFGVTSKNCVVMVVTADQDGDTYSIFKDGVMTDDARIPTTDPDILEESVGDFVEGDLSLYPTKTAILIKAEGDVRTGVIEMMKRGIANSGLAEDKEIHIAVEEK